MAVDYSVGWGQLSRPQPPLSSTAILPHPTPSYTCVSSAILPHPTIAYPVLHRLLLPSYPIQPRPTLAYPILHRILLPSYHVPVTLDSSAILLRPTLAYCHRTPSYLIQPCSLLPSYHILPHPTLQSTPSYTGFYCHPTTSPLHWILLPSSSVLP